MSKSHPIQFVLDCSVTMAWCFEDEKTPYTEKVLDNLIEATAITPILWSIEVANVLALAERKKRITHAIANEFISMLQKLPIKTEETIPKTYLENIHKLAKENHLTAYDAVYLNIALEHKLPIATLDKDLKKAAESHGIKIFHP